MKICFLGFHYWSGWKKATAKASSFSSLEAVKVYGYARKCKDCLREQFKVKKWH